MTPEDELEAEIDRRLTDLRELLEKQKRLVLED